MLRFGQILIDWRGDFKYSLLYIHTKSAKCVPKLYKAIVVPYGIVKFLDLRFSCENTTKEQCTSNLNFTILQF